VVAVVAVVVAAAVAVVTEFVRTHGLASTGTGVWLQAIEADLAFHSSDPPMQVRVRSRPLTKRAKLSCGRNAGYQHAVSALFLDVAPCVSVVGYLFVAPEEI
jgi:hypothetical protein